MARRGKIARLPKDIREQINRRLEDGQEGDPLLAWLNALPKVAEVLARDFGGSPVTKQNLSDWRAGGFVEWQAREEALAQAGELIEEAGALRANTGERLSTHLTTVLAARYAVVLAEWDGVVTEELGPKLRALHQLAQDIGVLRRGDQQDLRLELELERDILAMRTAKANSAAYEKLARKQEEWMANLQRDFAAIEARSPSQSSLVKASPA